MFRFQIPRGKNLLTWPPVLAALIGLGAIVALRSLNVFQRYEALRLERIKLEGEIRSLEAERRALEDQIRGLQSAGGIERLGKEKLGLKNPGEEVTVVVPEERPVPTTEMPSGFWMKIRRLTGRLLTVFGF